MPRILTASALSLMMAAMTAEAASLHVTQEGPGSVRVRSESHSNVQIQNGQVKEDAGGSMEILRTDTAGQETIERHEWKGPGTAEATANARVTARSTDRTREERIHARIQERLARLLERVTERRARRLAFRTAMNGVEQTVRLQSSVLRWSQSNR